MHWKLWHIYKRTSLVEVSFQFSCRSRAYPCNFKRNRLHHKGFPAWFLQDSSFQNFGKFSARYPCHYFSNKVATLLKMTCLKKLYGIFNCKGDLYCVKGFVYIWMLILMLMPRFPNGPTKVFPIPHCYGSSHFEALLKKNVLGIWKTKQRQIA